MLPLVSVSVTGQPPGPIRPLRESPPTWPEAVIGSSLWMEPKEVRAATS
jgi:hypothetical protein